MKIADDMVLVLRCCSEDFKSYGGFLWPAEGMVSAPDWEPTTECGRGLHGWLWGQGDVTASGSTHEQPAAKWLVVEVAKSDIIDLVGKVKFPRGTVIFSGSRDEAVKMISAAAPNGTAVIYGTASASAGHRGTASAGYGGTASAGDGGTASAGHRGTASAGDGGTASAGDGGTASAGHRGTASAGHRGSLLLRRWDSTLQRYRWVLGEVGLEGIEANVPYKLDDNGKLVK